MKEDDRPARRRLQPTPDVEAKLLLCGKAGALLLFGVAGCYAERSKVTLMGFIVAVSLFIIWRLHHLHSAIFKLN
jgi:hypothetical protein